MHGGLLPPEIIYVNMMKMIYLRYMGRWFCCLLPPPLLPPWLKRPPRRPPPPPPPPPPPHGISQTSLFFFTRLCRGTWKLCIIKIQINLESTWTGTDWQFSLGTCPHCCRGTWFYDKFGIRIRIQDSGSGCTLAANKILLLQLEENIEECNCSNQKTFLVFLNWLKIRGQFESGGTTFFRISTWREHFVGTHVAGAQ